MSRDFFTVDMALVVFTCSTSFFYLRIRWQALIFEVFFEVLLRLHQQRLAHEVVESWEECLEMQHLLG